MTARKKKLKKKKNLDNLIESRYCCKCSVRCFWRVQ